MTAGTVNDCETVANKSAQSSPYANSQLLTARPDALLVADLTALKM